MDIKNISITTLLCLIIALLFYINIGLNITGPYYYENNKDEIILQTVKKRFPKISTLYRHSFRYLTYSYYDNEYVYIFDNEGMLIISKEFNQQQLNEIQQFVEENYDLEEFEVQIGFGYNNIAYVIEQDDIILLIDYDTKEVIYYMRGDLL